MVVAKHVGDILSSSVPLASHESLETLLSDIDSKTKVTDTSVFPSTMMLTFPSAYLNKLGGRIDIYGEVEPGTREHKEGFRFFDSESRFYKDDGGCSILGETNDLVKKINPEEIADHQSPVRKDVWIHPQHYHTSIFFAEINQGKRKSTDCRHFLNRMGFLVIIHETRMVNGTMVLFDVDARSYQLSGHRETKIQTMTDLVYEVTNWSLFQKANWSDGKNSPTDDDDEIPELFNPIIDDRAMILDEFFKTILKASSLAKKLNIDYSFSMNDVKGFL